MLLLDRISHTTAKAVVECLLAQPLNVRAITAKRDSQHDVTFVVAATTPMFRLANVVRHLLMEMWSLYTVVFLSALLPGKSC